MKLTFLDWCVVAFYFLINLLIGLYYRKKAGASTAEFFVSGRQVTWWLAGTSMVATTFAADTPLAVTGLVARQGIAGNWLWWNFLLSGMMTVFFFARLWRRSGTITDAEFVELRYAGRPAAFLRGFRSLYFGILMNCLVVGWVNLAMVKILMTALNISRFWALAICLLVMAVTGFYTTLSGLWGVLWTDVLQFALKMGMVILLAYYSVRAVGGIDALKIKLAAIDLQRGAEAGGSGSILSFVPDLSSPWMPLLTFVVYIGVSWWANWYPGAEPGGGGYVAQRIFSAKNEKHSLWAVLWFNIAHYALRPWPWILTALVSVVLYPNLADPEVGYVKVWVDHLPAALRGFMLAAFAAAYMSTIATQLNWGSSYIVNDFYRRFLAAGRDERHYVLISRLSTAFLALLGAAVSLVMDSVSGAWQLLLGIGAGTGAVYLLRWYWWRINAWSEVAAMAAAAVMTALLHTLVKLTGSESIVFAKSILLTVAVTTVVWLTATFITQPEPDSKLIEFYRRVRPGVFGWGRVAVLAPEVPATHEGWYNLLDWFLGCLMVYMALFGIGKIVLGSAGIGLLFLMISGVSGYAIYWDFSRRGWEKLS
ncbi:MAG: Na+:solute symporter [Acidobacteria bacterium]|nr:Na+:solute symporter [Acidobacteriota bacterium]